MPNELGAVFLFRSQMYLSRIVLGKSGLNAQ